MTAEPRTGKAARPKGGRATRRDEVLAAALTVFAQEGFAATSVRDIAERCGMLSGSLYYHFPSKEELYAHLHAAAVARLIAQVEAALVDERDPWIRLARAVGVHLEAILRRDEDALLVMTPLSRGLDGVRQQIIAKRDAYEDLFRTIVEELDLAEGVDRVLFRLHLIGALNWTHAWYHPGRLSPGEIAERMMSIALRCRAEPDSGGPEAPERTGRGPTCP